MTGEQIFKAIGRAMASGITETNIVNAKNERVSCAELRRSMLVAGVRPVSFEHQGEVSARVSGGCLELVAG